MSAVVIGSAGTIGGACATDLSRAHGTVFGLDLVTPVIDGVTSQSLDITDAEAVATTLAEIDNLDPITALVYAAGLNTTGFVETIEWTDYERVMAVNLRGAFHTAAALSPRLREHPRGFGCVFISSTAGLRGEAGGSIYCATKFGLRGLVESFAAEIAPYQGRANTVCPGNVESSMLTELAEKFGKRQGRPASDVLDELAAENAFNRLITPEEVARTCSWLTSESASGISGQTIVVDGAPA